MNDLAFFKPYLERYLIIINNYYSLLRNLNLIHNINAKFANQLYSNVNKLRSKDRKRVSNLTRQLKSFNVRNVATA